MNISEAIAQLQKLEAKHGNIDVYFDCPKCGQSFAPNTAVAVAVHLTEGKG
jgi:uncharacterized protein (UPF0212 family)